MSNSSSQSDYRKRYLIIIFIVFLALTLRLVNLGNFEVAGDEGSYAIRGIGWNDFMVSTTMTTPWNWFFGQKLPSWTQLSFFDHPPLHFASIWLVSHLLGISLWTVRLSAVIFGTLSVLLLMLICYRLGWPKIAPWVGLWLAVLPWHVWISRQAQQESQLIFLIFLTIYLLLKIDNKKIYYWILTGIVIGAAILTKYSAIVISPLILWYFFQRKWYKKVNFWLLVLTVLIVISPVIFYNLKMDQARGHFDLQLARLLHQDQSIDWPANVQQLIQGGPADFLSFGSQIIEGVRIIAVLIIILGLVIGFSQRPKFFIKNIFLTYGMLLLVIVIVSLTLADRVRGTVIIPFLSLTFGISLQLLPQKFKTNIILPTLAIIILLPATFNLYGNDLNWPNYLGGSFKPEDKGFLVWEKWLEENQPAEQKIIHFSSLNQWAERLYQLTLFSQEPIIIFDYRFNWFALNWHFLRHSFYTTNYAVIHPAVFVNFLVSDPELSKKLADKKIIYVQAEEISRDFKIRPDEQTELFDSILKLFISEQKIEPEILKNTEDQQVAKIWSLRWKPSIKIIGQND